MDVAYRCPKIFSADAIGVFFSDLADRSGTKWEEQGKPVLVNEATAKVTAILAEGDNEVLDGEIDARLLARFGLPLD